MLPGTVPSMVPGTAIREQNYLQIYYSLSVLGWYIPGLSELPLRHHRFLRLLAGPFQRFFFFCISLGTFRCCSFFLLPFRVRAHTRSTAPRASPASSWVSAGGGE